MNAAELEALNVDTAAKPAEPAAAPGAPALAQPAELTEAQQWAALPATAGFVFAMYLPELEPVYSEEACNRWGEAFAKFAERRGWKASVVLAWLEPLIPLALATKPLLVPTVSAFRRKAAELRAAKLDPGGERKAEPAA